MSQEELLEKVTNWYRKRFKEVEKEYPGHIPKDLVFEEDVLPYIKIIELPFFVIVVTDSTHVSEKFPGYEHNYGNADIMIFDKNMNELGAAVLVHGWYPSGKAKYSSKKRPPKYTFDNNPIFTDWRKLKKKKVEKELKNLVCNLCREYDIEFTSQRIEKLTEGLEEIFVRVQNTASRIALEIDQPEKISEIRLKILKALVKEEERNQSC